MSRFARVFKCICAVVALGVLVTGLTAQVDKTAETAVSSGSAVFAASITEDYTDPETEHATIRRAGQIASLEVSKEVTGSTNESIARRTASGSSSAAAVRYLVMLTMVLAAASGRGYLSHPVAHAEGAIHSAEQTIISYIHSQGNFIG